MTEHARQTRTIDATAITAMAAMTAAAWFIGVNPVLKARAEHDALRADADERIAELALAQHEQRSLAESLAEAERALENATVRLVPSRRLNQRVAGLTDLATRHGLQLDEIRPGRKSRAELFDIVEVRLSGQVGYPNAAAFFHALHNAYPDMEVGSFRLAAKGTTELPADVFQFNLVWYAAPDDAAD